MEKKLAINRIKAVLAEKGISHKFQPTLKLLREIAFALDVDIRELLIPTRDR
jgi:putative transcriptional regulator